MVHSYPLVDLYVYCILLKSAFREFFLTSFVTDLVERYLVKEKWSNLKYQYSGIYIPLYSRLHSKLHFPRFGSISMLTMRDTYLYQ